MYEKSNLENTPLRTHTHPGGGGGEYLHMKLENKKSFRANAVKFCDCSPI